MGAAIAGIRFRGIVPLVLLTTLIVAVGAYTAVGHDAFLTNYNLRNLVLAAMPLALVGLGQTCALLVGGFDISVGALLTFCVVLASYTMTPTTSTAGLIPGALALIGVGLAVGIFNALLVRMFRLPSIIVTIGTTAILTGASLWLRDHPAGAISSNAIDALTTSWSFLPVAAIGVIVLALAGDFWLYRTRSGMAMRAVGLDPTSARRIGIRTDWVVILAFVGCSLLASIGGLYQAAYGQIGSPLVGNQSLESIAAAVLGGASLAGGRGSFFGTLLAALFLTEIDNSLALSAQPTEYAEITIGVLILVALVLYEAPDLIARLRSSRLAVGRLRTRAGEAPAG